MPEPRDSTARPRRQKKAARVATSPARMPWPMRLVLPNQLTELLLGEP